MKMSLVNFPIVFSETKCFARKMNIKKTQKAVTIRHHNENILIFLQTCFEFSRDRGKKKMNCCRNPTLTLRCYFLSYSSDTDIVVMMLRFWCMLGWNFIFFAFCH